MRLRYCSVEITSSFLMLVISLISLQGSKGQVLEALAAPDPQRGPQDIWPRTPGQWATLT